MHYLRTKLGEVSVSPSDTLHLIVPAGYSSPCIITLNTGKFRVRYWDATAQKQASRGFHKLRDAQAFKATVVCERHSLLREVTVSDVLANHRYFSTYYRLDPQAVEFVARDVPLPGYWLGLWLGDGTSRDCAIANIEPEVYIKEVAVSFGLRVARSGIVYRIIKQEGAHRGSTGGPITRQMARAIVDAVLAGSQQNVVAAKLGVSAWTVSKYMQMHKTVGIDGYFDGLEARQNPITLALKQLGVWGNKHIPKCYLENSRQVRMDLLAGLIDTDGYYGCGYYAFGMANERLTNDIVTLARSLGFMARDPKKIMANCTNASAGPKKCVAYQISVAGGNELMDIPVRVQRKKCQPKVHRYDQLAFEIVTMNPAC